MSPGKMLHTRNFVRTQTLKIRGNIAPYRFDRYQKITCLCSTSCFKLIFSLWLDWERVWVGSLKGCYIIF